MPDSLERCLYRGVPITLIDIGAHAGEFTQAAKEFCGIKEALLVEPQPTHAANLRRRFPGREFRVVEAALAETESTIELEINGFDATTSILPTYRSIPEIHDVDTRVREIVSCRVQTLDAAAADMHDVDLVKLDVQGAEHLVIGGGTATLGRTRLLWCEVSFRPLYEGSALFADIYKLVYEAGFRMTALEPGFRSPCGGCCKPMRFSLESSRERRMK